MKFLTALLFLLPAIAFSQQADSIKILNKASLKDSTRMLSKDSLVVMDSLKQKIQAKPDTIIAIKQKPFNHESYFITREMKIFQDYRYAGEILGQYSLNYQNDYGSIGKPNETFLYGVGNNGISILKDGILQNNRLLNSFDLNNVQTEDIDSVEISPLPRGFLYGSYANPVSVNFLSRDVFSAQPYTRIKYYQGPDGEAMIDGILNEKISKKFNFYFDFTNRKYDSSYTNTAYSEWMVNLKLKYFADDKINITGSYGFEHSKVGLNGGINIDSLTSSDNLYSPYQAPVVYNAQTQGYKFHYFNLRLLSTYFDNSLTDLNFYYKFDYTELNRYGDTTSFYKTINNDKVFGVSLKEDYKQDIFNFQLNSVYETSNIKYYSLTDSTLNYYPVKFNNFSLSAVVSAYLLDSSLVPSVYYKLSNESGNENYTTANGTYNGLGADITYKAAENLKFYIGYSNFKTWAHSNFSQSYEAGIVAAAGNLFTDIKVFKCKDLYLSNPYSFLLTEEKINPDLTGIGANINYEVWKFLLETQTSYYTTDNSTELLYLFPKINFTGGLYYKNILFENNLRLKTGVIYSYSGRRNSSIGELDPYWKLDFTASGEIKKVAMVYFTWENIFNNKYYIIPYYPMYPRGIRFGIAWELFN